jgi:hypothetical protein
MNVNGFNLQTGDDVLAMAGIVAERDEAMAEFREEIENNGAVTLPTDEPYCCEDCEAMRRESRTMRSLRLSEFMIGDEFRASDDYERQRETYWANVPREAFGASIYDV